LKALGGPDGQSIARAGGRRYLTAERAEDAEQYLLLVWSVYAYSAVHVAFKYVETWW
jgi:hypothetical protein